MDSPDTGPITWTRVVPGHCNPGIKSPSPPTDVDKLSFPFMFLPVEIRLQIYRIYLVDRYALSPREALEMVFGSHNRTESSAEILRVSKTVNTEVRDLLQHEKTITVRVCWHNATLDGFAKSCLQARGMHLDYDRIAHLRVEIYPRPPDCPTDIIRIWQNVQSLCSDLQKASCVQKLSLYFMETEYAAWSRCGLPLATLRWLDFMQMEYAVLSISGGPGATLDAHYGTDRKPWDILPILNLFRLLKNVKMAQIHLPLSVTEDLRLQEARKNIEGVMMQTISLDDRHQKSVTDTIERPIADREAFFKGFMDSCAQERLHRLRVRRRLLHAQGRSQHLQDLAAHGL